MIATAPRVTPATQAILIAGPLLYLALIRIDAALGLIALVLLAGLSLIGLVPARFRWRWLALAPILGICGVLWVRFISVCLFVVCAPAPWAAQLAAAQQAIDQVGPGFQAVDVWDREDPLARYRSDARPNRTTTIFFARADPSRADGAYLYYSIDVNDRDPPQSRQVIAGIAYGDLALALRGASAVAAIQLSPREALAALNRQRAPTEQLGDPLVSLASSDPIPGVADRPARWQILSTRQNRAYYVDAASGALLGVVAER